jgi:hypothetical protein
VDKLRGRSFGPVTVKGPGGDAVEVVPDDDLAISGDLDGEMREHAALFAWYAARAEDAQAVVKQVRFQIHCLEEDLSAALRKEQLGKPRGERMSIKDIETEVKRHPKMRMLYGKVVEAERVRGKLYALREAFSQRKDMLQSMGANYRHSNELRTRTLDQLKQAAHHKQHNEEQ